MKQSRWKNIGRAFRREQHHILHDKNVLVVILLAPLFYAFFYPSIYWHKTEQEVAVVVLDQDHSAWSHNLLRKLDSHPLIRIASQCQNQDEGRHALESMSAYALVVIPTDAEKELKTDHSITLVVQINSTRFLVSNDLSKAINEVVQEESQKVSEQWLQEHGKWHAQAAPLNVDVRALFNPTDTYGDFFIPALIVLILQQTLFIGLAETVAKEREIGSLAQWRSSSGNQITSAILGKGLFYFLLFFGYGALFLSVHFPLFKLPNHGNLLLQVLMMTLFLACIVIMAMLISTFFKSKLIAMQCTVFTSYPIFLMSGFSWPLWSMPWFLRGVAQLLPTTPYLAAFTRITQMGAGLAQVWPQALHLAVLLLLSFALLYMRLDRLFHHVEHTPHSLQQIHDEICIRESTE